MEGRAIRFGEVEECPFPDRLLQGFHRQAEGESHTSAAFLDRGSTYKDGLTVWCC